MIDRAHALPRTGDRSRSRQNRSLCHTLFPGIPPASRSSRPGADRLTLVIMDTEPQFPNPAHLFEEFQAFHRSLALRTALELDLFTHIDSGAATVDALARKCHASERGIRILCDFLVVTGHLLKQSNTYRLPVNSTLYLSTNSPAYIGSAANFLAGDDALRSFGRLTEAVQTGSGTTANDDAFQATSYWKGFAESMASFAAPVARMAAACVDIDCDRPMNILDIAAGHGLYGLAMAARNPLAHIFALDFPAVLEVAERNARTAGMIDRYHLIPGDVFETELGGPYDMIVAANFVHHFDKTANTTLFRSFISVLVPSGQLVLVDFVPNDDRVSPAIDAAFALNMLATTAHGNTYTFREFEAMLTDAGFRNVRQPEVGDLPHWVITASP